MNPPIPAVLEALALSHDAPAQPLATFAAIERAAADILGHRLFTVLVYWPGASESQRIYSNMPDAYPVGGRKAVTNAPWMQQVVQRGEFYIGRNAQDLREVFYDHELIDSLGCQSVLNLPVRWQGQTLGTVNLLHREGWYNESHVAPARVLAQLALPALMGLQ